jgi:hypothetical protein
MQYFKPKQFKKYFPVDRLVSVSVEVLFIIPHERLTTPGYFPKGIKNSH